MSDFKEEIVSGGLMRVAEASDFLGLSKSTVYGLMGRGELPWVKLGRARRIPRRAVIDLAAGSLRKGSWVAGKGPRPHEPSRTALRCDSGSPGRGE